LQQRGVAHHAEGPLVGVGNDRHRFVLEETGPAFALPRRKRHVLRRQRLAADQQALLEKAGVEFLRPQLLEIRQRAGGKTANDAPVEPVHAPVTIAEGPAIDGERRGWARVRPTHPRRRVSC
jgi:hypothetical protein